MGRPDILWRPTWNEGEAPEHFSAFDGTRAVGRIYPKETLIGGKEWLWFGADAMATGRCASRREAMLQLETGIWRTGTNDTESNPLAGPGGIVGGLDEIFSTTRSRTSTTQKEDPEGASQNGAGRLLAGSEGRIREAQGRNRRPRRAPCSRCSS